MLSGKFPSWYKENYSTWISGSTAKNVSNVISPNYICKVNETLCIIGGSQLCYYNPNENTYLIKGKRIRADYMRMYCSIGNNIYSLYKEIGKYDTTRHMSCYDILTDSETTVTQLDSVQQYSSLINVGNLIYVMGGNDDRKYNSNSNRCFDVQTNTWTTKAYMTINNTSGNGATVKDNSIYLAGGFYIYDSVNSTPHIPNLEYFGRYDTLSDTWGTLPNLPNISNDGSYDFPVNICTCGEYIYILSAYLPNNFMRYNISSNNLETLEPIPVITPKPNNIQSDGKNVYYMECETNQRTGQININVKVFIP